MSYEERIRNILPANHGDEWPEALEYASREGTKADAEIAALRLLYDGATRRSEVQAEKIAALRARVEALEAGLREVCDDYEEIVEGEFGPDPEPIETVVRARALLEQKP